MPSDSSLYLAGLATISAAALAVWWYAGRQYAARVAAEAEARHYRERYEVILDRVRPVGPFRPADGSWGSDPDGGDEDLEDDSDLDGLLDDGDDDPPGGAADDPPGEQTRRGL